MCFEAGEFVGSSFSQFALRGLVATGLLLANEAMNPSPTRSLSGICGDHLGRKREALARKSKATPLTAPTSHGIQVGMGPLIGHFSSHTLNLPWAGLPKPCHGQWVAVQAARVLAARGLPTMLSKAAWMLLDLE